MTHSFEIGDTVLFEAGKYGAAVGVLRETDDEEGLFVLSILQSTHEDIDAGGTHTIPKENDNLYPVPAPVCITDRSSPQQ